MDGFLYVTVNTSIRHRFPLAAPKPGAHAIWDLHERLPTPWNLDSKLEGSWSRRSGLN
jgi:hypothetical protein